MRRILRLFHKSRDGDQLDKELRFHIERQIADYVEGGMSPEEARRQARLEFGGHDQIKEEVHDTRRFYFIQDFVRDLRYGIRMLRKSPGFTFVAVLTLALGIGANTAIYAAVDSLLIRPLPVPDAQQITVLAYQQRGGELQTLFSHQEWKDVHEQTSSVFAGVVGAMQSQDGLTANGHVQPMTISYVTGNFFSVLGVQPVMGRMILPSEGFAAGADPVMVLSYSYWKARFGGNPRVLGQSVAVNGRPVTIIGIAPDGFHGTQPLLDIQGYMPAGMITVENWVPKDVMENRGLRNFQLLARLRPEVSIEQAQAALHVVAQRLARQNPDTEEGFVLHLFPERLSRPRPGLAKEAFKSASLFLFLTALILVLACVNIANILLARAAARRRETTIRLVLGATGGRLARQFLTESLLLAIAGGVVGTLLALAACRAGSSLRLGTDVPVLIGLHMDGRIFVFVFLIVLMSGILVGILPAMQACRGDLGATLREGGRGTVGQRTRLRSVFVVSQVGGALMVLILAGLFTRSLSHAQKVELGFEPSRLLNITVDPQELGYSEARARVFCTHVLERVRALPGVQSVSMAFAVPMGYNSASDTVRIPGYVPPTGQPETPIVPDNFVSPDYFQNLRIPLLRGRPFTDADDSAAPGVVIVNEAMAQTFWPNQDSIGKELTFGDGPPRKARVVGVVRNSRYDSIAGPIGPYFYAPIAQVFSYPETLQVRTFSADPTPMIREITDAVQAVDPQMPIFGVETMRQALDTKNGLLVYQFGAAVAAALGALGLILAVVGVYGVVSYSMSQRVQEISIRMALGAQSSSILRLMLRRGLSVIVVGIVAGMIAAFAMARMAGGFLVNVSPGDPLTYAVVSAVVLLAALLACYLPSSRAIRVDPIVALRNE